MPNHRSLATLISITFRSSCLFFLLVLLFYSAKPREAHAEEPTKPEWQYLPELLRPFWQGNVMEGESVLFIKDPKTGEAKASVLFPVEQVLAVRNSAGDVTYENGRDYAWKPESREIVVPAGSRIVSRLPSELRRPAKSQKYELTHRDGNGEIFFGARLEYAEMQTCITYRHKPHLWKSPVPRFDAEALPRSVHKLLNKEPLSIVVVGDSISAGCNASGWAEGAPYQPPYPELLRRHLEVRFQGQAALQNPSVSGTDTRWVLTTIDKVVEPKPDLVIVAFGMNDAAGRSAKEYRANTEEVLAKIRERLPDVEFILVASMLGNRDWTRLQQDLFPQYRDALAGLCRPGIALADLTSIWAGFLELKQDWDQTGNGVNHPNDFGHRVYAQVLATLLDPNAEPDAALPVTADKPREIKVRRTENQIRYGLIGEVGKTPAPTLLVLAHGIEDMQREPVYTEIAGLLSQQGWLSVVIDPPCHGEDVRPGEPAQLQGWRHRLEHDDEFVAAFNAKVRDVLDALVKDKVTDPERVAACGISRGAFLAFHLAAAEPRIKAVAGISPVTNLLALREFADTSQRKKFEQLDVRRLAPKLAGRAVWLSIGNNDTRVNTDDAIAFTREVVRATARPDMPDGVIPVELLVAPTAGHSKIDQAHELLAAWLVNRFPPAKPTTEKSSR